MSIFQKENQRQMLQKYGLQNLEAVSWLIIMGVFLKEN